MPCTILEPFLRALFNPISLHQFSSRLRIDRSPPVRFSHTLLRAADVMLNPSAPKSNEFEEYPSNNWSNNSRLHDCRCFGLFSK